MSSPTPIACPSPVKVAIIRLDENDAATTLSPLPIVPPSPARERLLKTAKSPVGKPTAKPAAAPGVGKPSSAPPKLKLFALSSLDQSSLRSPASASDASSPSDAFSFPSAASSLSQPLPSPLPVQRGLPSDYQAFIHASRYARWVESKRRRE
ncbi:hypothetical protein Agub_g9775, partial [Astrephomene gubernaculifera]